MEKITIKIGKKNYYSIDLEKEYTMEINNHMRVIWAKYLENMAHQTTDKKNMNMLSILNNPYENEILAMLFRENGQNEFNEDTFKKLSKYFKTCNYDSKLSELYQDFLSLKVESLNGYILSYLEVSKQMTKKAM